MDIALLGMSTIGTIAFIVGVAYLLKYFGISMFSGLPGTRQTALLLGIGAVVVGAATGSGPLAETLQGVGGEEDVGPVQANVLEFQDAAGVTHVTEIEEDKTVLIQYKENTSSGNALFAGDDSEMDTVGFTIDVFNTDEDNDHGAQVLSVNDTYDNNDDDVSEWDLIVKRSDDSDNMAITPSGGSTSYGEATFLVSNYSSTEVTINFEPNDTPLANLELYDSVTVSIRLEDANGALQGTRTIELQKVGEVA